MMMESGVFIAVVIWSNYYHIRVDLNTISEDCQGQQIPCPDIDRYALDHNYGILYPYIVENSIQ